MLLKTDTRQTRIITGFIILYVQCQIGITSAAAAAAADLEVANLTCSLEDDFCGWTTQTETLNPEKFDLGWTTFSPHLDGNLSFEGDHFAVAKTKDDMRTFLITSPYSTSTGVAGKEWLSLSFRYAVTGDSSITVYTLQEKSYRYLWSSSEFEIDGRGGEEDEIENTSENATYENQTEPTNKSLPKLNWNNETLSNLCKAIDTSKIIQICFVAYVKPNEMVALSDVRTKSLSQEPFICEGISQLSPANVNPNSPPTDSSWRFFIVFSLLLAFGAVFLTALLVIGRSNKPTLIPSNIERTQNFQNPTFGFRYDRLDEETEA